MRKKCAVLFIICILTAALCGCVDISERTVTAVKTTTTAPAASEPVIISVETTTGETTVPFVTTGDVPETDSAYSDEIGRYTLSEEDKELLSGCIFVGDSICSGLRNYGILPADRVAAQGNIAARNIFDFTFTKDGDELSLLSLLVDGKPDSIVFSMGMNDVNITSTQEFAENYRNLLTTVEGFLPNARLFVLSITPVTEDSNFTANENIDNFNAELKKMLDGYEKWTYVDITPEMKNSRNAMKDAYSGGDGVHLAPEAYDAILSQFCAAALAPPEEAMVEVE